jgi:ubiquinone/menaquinone biosynthesis C-methylase UbiE
VIKFLNKEQCAHFLQEAQRVLKPGGKLVITNNTPADTENRENGSNIKRNAQIQEQINKQKEQIQ